MISADDLPMELSVRGQALTSAVKVSLGDSSRAIVVPLSARLGAHDVDIIRHPSAEELVVQAPRGLGWGTHDFSLLLEGDLLVTQPGALLVTPSEDGTGSGSSSGNSSDATDPLGECVGFHFEDSESITLPDIQATAFWSPTFGSDERTMYFAATVDGKESLWRARRSDRGVAFAQPTRVMTEFSEVDVGTPFIDSQGSTLYVFATATTSLGERDLYALSGGGVGFPRTRHLRELSSTGRDHLPWISRDESWMVFVSDRPDGDEDLFTARRSTPEDGFDAPTPLTSLNSDQNEGRAFITSDGLTAVFASNRPGGAGDYDLWAATRATLGEEFGNIVNLSEVNSERRDFDVTLTPDERELFFVRDLGGATVLLRALRLCDS